MYFGSGTSDGKVGFVLLPWLFKFLQCETLT